MVTFGPRFVLSLVVAVVAVTIVFDSTRVIQEKGRLTEQMKREVRAISRTLEIAVSGAVRKSQWEEVQALADDVGSSPEIARVTLYGPDLVVRIRSQGGEGVGESPAGVRREVLMRRRSRDLTLDGPEGRTYHLLTPLRLQEGRQAGVLEVVYQASLIDRKVRQRLWEVLGTRALIIAVLAFAFWYLTFRIISRPVQSLIDGVVDIRRGNLDMRIDLGRKDEFGRLAAEFNRMALNLKRVQERLREEAESRLELERQVRQAEKLAAIGKLASGIAHEVGTPLNVILGRAEYLLADLPPEDPRARSLTIILRQIDRISGIIQQLLRVVRTEKPELKPVEVTQVIREVSTFLDHEFRQRQVTLVTELAPDVPPIAADPDQLQQVFLNLMMNALEATEPGGEVRVSALRVDSVSGTNGDPGVEVQVADTGCGIPEEEQARIFEPFYSTKPPGTGTGLGLSITQGIVRDHRGTIRVESAVGKGTTFFLRFPLVRSRQG